MTEVELKLLLAPGDAKKIPGVMTFLGAGAGERRLFTSIYFDTPALELRERRVALRVRRAAGRWVQTLKAEGSAGAGLTRRPEWESAVAGPQPDVTALDDSRCRKLVPESIQRRLVPVFETRFWRTLWTLVPNGDTSVEFCLDRGEIRAQGRRVPLCELELELRAGSAATLYRLATAVFDAVPVRVGVVSKAARGYRLFLDEPPRPVKAVPVSLDAAAGTGAAVRAIGNAALAQLAANAEQIGDTDTEFLHQARIGVRRLRAAISLGRGLLDAGAAAGLVGELRWLMSALGPARDWDVFVDDTLASLEPGFRSAPGFGGLRNRARRKREAARRAAAAAVADRRFTAALLGAGLLFETARDLPGETVRGFSARVLKRRLKRLRKLGHGLAARSPEERHAARIAAKKLRYATDAFAGLFPARAAKAYVRAVAAVQDVLGAQNDAVVCDRLLAEITAGETDAALLRLAGRVDGWMAAMARRRMKKLETVMDALLKLRPIWK